jgi:regulator of sigma E protease
MLLNKIAIFILFLGPLVFFHELGHFLFARFFGVRVETFSIGFGPKILKWKKGFTEYAVSLFPLGGYVKMFGDDPFEKDSVPEELRQYSYSHKGKWARFWIVFGGPLANFIMAYFIFFTLLVSGERLPEIKIGYVGAESKFYTMGIRSGDVLRKVNGSTVTSPNDIILQSGDHIQSLTFKRLGEDVTVNVDIGKEQFFTQMAEYPPFLVQPIVKKTDGTIYGISTTEKEVDWSISLVELANISQGKDLFFHQVAELRDIQESPVLELSSAPTKMDFVIGDNMIKSLISNGYYPIDLVVKSVNMKSPADKAGLKAGDIISKVDGKIVDNFDLLRSTIQKDKEGVKSYEIELIRDGKTITENIEPEVKKISGNEVKIIGVYSAGRYVKGKYVETEPLGLGAALVKSGSRTVESVVKTIEGFKKLLTAQTSFKNIGGPIAIGKVASDSFNTSLSYFFQLMALISVNLGVINLFPIPVLDGGHIMFIILETLNGGPLSRRKLEMAQQFGLSLLLLLMVGAIFNDFVRFF